MRFRRSNHTPETQTAFHTGHQKLLKASPLPVSPFSVNDYIMRLDKFISHTLSLTRTEVRKALKSGAVQLNTEVEKNPAQQVSQEDRVLLHGEPVVYPQPRYFMLHKPAGYVCATQDSTYPTVIDLIDERSAHRLQIAGRLDLDTTGLVLITDDGNWNHRITAPGRQCNKVYRVTLATPLNPETTRLFAEGICLKNEKKPTRPAQLTVIDEHCVRLTIHEGKYHQVKRMFAAAGNRVIALHREQIGTIMLPPDLPAGSYRPLTTQEIASA